MRGAGETKMNFWRMFGGPIFGLAALQAMAENVRKMGGEPDPRTVVTILGVLPTIGVKVNVVQEITNEVAKQTRRAKEADEGIADLEQRIAYLESEKKTAQRRGNQVEGLKALLVVTAAKKPA